MPVRKEEKIYRGVAVSGGVAIGSVSLLKKVHERPPERSITEKEVPKEMERLRHALQVAHDEIKNIQKRIASKTGSEQARIFDVQIDMLRDENILREVEQGMHQQKKNVEWVFYQVLNKYIHFLAGTDDDFFIDRHTDIRDVMNRVLRHLTGVTKKDFSKLPFASIVIAHDLAPSDTVMMDKGKILAFATDLGGRTSHTAIIAQALRLPAVVGLHDLSIFVHEDDRVILDGNRGIIIVNPTEDTVQRYNDEIFRIKLFENKLLELKDLPAETVDGRRLTLSANIELPEELDAVIEAGADGIGLYRTEFLYMNRNDLPMEDEQFENYKKVLETMKPNSVIIRTFDLGGDKFISHLEIPYELNPFLGWRAIRFCLQRLDLFKVQLRAILRASVYGNLKLMYPMISNVNEFKAANAVVNEVKQELGAEGIPFSENFEIGAMIEIPSAALTADILAKEADFFSIGTNDLIQYTLAVERTNDMIAHLYKPCHPAVLRLIKQTIEEAHKNDIWIGICGEMAAEPAFSILLVGMGMDELSISPAMVPKVKKAIRSMTDEEMKELAEEVLTMTCAEDIERRAIETLKPKLPEFFEATQ